ncbi:MAG: ATP synthase F0 subunit B [Candidatus Obscuribacter sp.]|jgi:F-type H+-transporting ATPase subunit b|nr:ATP synthase F0 subunit B [Candidatus Obscuribacter sp.]MBL0187205.1 ATP synthase F0 subunit B [Candidatus Obscuribacter sp.]MBP6350568.1 ATP synthase F0 subunit B [Candidatus Obscuribacter sp.]MBP6593859.1 ATP synthase F0 subunit B [Candidatus Obscuribacter sp.]MBP7577003.1 ATP synthase F0 subunit B [Candidatus Obscuribacter sp.]
MLELNGTFLILIASFLAFIYLLDGVFVKPISKVMSARAAKIEKDLVESKGYRQEAEGVLSQYQTRLAEIREKAQITINDAVAEAQKSRTAQIDKIQSDGRAKIAQAKQALAGEKLMLIDQLVDEEVKLVDIIMSKLIGTANAGQKLDRAAVKRSLEEAC